MPIQHGGSCVFDKFPDNSRAEEGVTHTIIVSGYIHSQVLLPVRKTQNFILEFVCVHASIQTQRRDFDSSPCRATRHRPVASSNEQIVAGLPWGPCFRAGTPYTIL